MGLKKTDVTNYDVQDKRVATWRCSLHGPKDQGAKSIGLPSICWHSYMNCFRAPSELQEHVLSLSFVLQWNEARLRNQTVDCAVFSHVEVVIGGGDTAVDCVGTAIRVLIKLSVEL